MSRSKLKRLISDSVLVMSSRLADRLGPHTPSHSVAWSFGCSGKLAPRAAVSDLTLSS